MRDKVKSLADKFFSEVVRIRRHIHQHPELSFQETNTSIYIQNTLREAGIAFKSGLAGTGILATIEGRNANGKSIALRADIDALPIQEENDKPYRSLNDGVMHACGHDVHTASLLGAAFILNELKDRFEGTVKLIFQPGEEKLPGGAKLMIEQGVLRNPEPAAIFGQHVHPPLEAGKVGFRSGYFMASADEVFIKIRGKGGHAALPQDCIDPIQISLQLISALQQMMNRRDPLIHSVFSIGKIYSVGGSTNIIPDEVRLEGTFRTLDESWRKESHRLLKSTSDQVVSSLGGKCECTIIEGYPSLYNDQKTTAKAESAAREYLGEEAVVELSTRMSAEDFSYYSQVVPACFYRLGTSNSKAGINSPVHTSTFDVDEECLRVGSGLMAYIALRELLIS